MGYEYDAGGGAEEVTYYNGYRAHQHVCGPVDYLHGDEAKPGPHGAHALGIERMAETGLQTRGVMVDLHAHVGLEAVPVGYDALMRIMEADKVEVEPGDVLCLRTGFDRALLGHYADAGAAFDPHRCSGLDGFDERLQHWVADSGVAALVSDNEAVEFMPDFVTRRRPRHPRAAASSVPVQTGDTAGRTVPAERPRRLAARGGAEPVPVHRAAAQAAGGGGVSGDGGWDGLIRGACHVTLDIFLP